MARGSINDSERALWVDNDEGLYNWWKSSRNSKHKRMSKTEFIKENRAAIDEVINNVLGGKKPAHYLAYGSTSRPTY